MKEETLYVKTQQEASGTEVHLEVGQDFSSLYQRDRQFEGNKTLWRCGVLPVCVCLPGSILHTFKSKYMTITRLGRQ